MDGIAAIVGTIALLSLLVFVPLSILRSLDAIKASQRRLERRLE